MTTSQTIFVRFNLIILSFKFTLRYKEVLNVIIILVAGELFSKCCSSRTFLPWHYMVSENWNNMMEVQFSYAPQRYRFKRWLSGFKLNWLIVSICNSEPLRWTISNYKLFCFCHGKYHIHIYGGLGSTTTNEIRTEHIKHLYSVHKIHKTFW